MSCSFLFQLSLEGLLTLMDSIGNAYSSTNAEKFTSRLVARYRSLVEKIYRDGGRKFLLLNVPAASRSPMFLDQGDEAVKSHAEYLSVFNESLESMVKNFTADHEDVCFFSYLEEMSVPQDADENRPLLFSMIHGRL